jgi:hypothetical protein
MPEQSVYKLGTITLYYLVSLGALALITIFVAFKSEFAGFVFLIGVFQLTALYLTCVVGRADRDIKSWLIIQTSIVLGWWILAGVFYVLSIEGSYGWMILFLAAPWFMMFFYASMADRV